MRAFSLILFAVLTCFVSETVSAQTTDRTIDEIKTETLARAQTGAYPALGIQPVDASDALGRINSRDPDEWAAAWSAVADGYMAKAKVATDPKEADANFVRAWRLYYFGQWPAPTSPGKQAAYQRAIDAYLQHARYFDPPLEVVRIPFEGKEIVGYLRLPANAKRPAPLVLAISGLDSRKETVAETYAAALAEGVGFFAVDSPGTGQAPRKADETWADEDTAVRNVMQFMLGASNTNLHPLTHALDELESWLDEHPDQTAVELLTEFQARYPGFYTRSHLRTLRRRVQIWRREAIQRLICNMQDHTQDVSSGTTA